MAKTLSLSNTNVRERMRHSSAVTDFGRLRGATAGIGEQMVQYEGFSLCLTGMVKEAKAQYRAKKSEDAREKEVRAAEEPGDSDNGGRGAIEVAKAIPIVKR